MRRVALLATVLTTMLTTMLTLAGCAASEGEETSEGPSAEQRIELTFEGGSTPDVQRVAVETGQEVELVIKSDEPGELHVHAEPEQVLEYAAGTTSVKVSIDQPGLVEVERHDTEALVLQLEVG